MKVSEKIEPAKNAIRFISRHDDANADTIDNALDSLVSFIQTEKQEAAARRAEKANLEAQAAAKAAPKTK